MFACVRLWLHVRELCSILTSNGDRLTFVLEAIGLKAFFQAACGKWNLLTLFDSVIFPVFLLALWLSWYHQSLHSIEFEVFKEARTSSSWNILNFPAGCWWFQEGLTNVVLALLFTRIFCIFPLVVNYLFHGKGKIAIKYLFSFLLRPLKALKILIWWFFFFFSFNIMWSFFDPGEKHCGLRHLGSLFLPWRRDWAA